MTSSKSWSDSKINYITRSLIDVAKHLSINDIIVTDAIIKECSIENSMPLSVLLVGHRTVFDAIIKGLIANSSNTLSQFHSEAGNPPLNDSDKVPVINASNITTMTLSEFIKARFTKRYDLGGFIDPSLFEGEEVALKQLSTITTRLRDLFVRHSLIFTVADDKANDIYPSLGYTTMQFNQSDLDIQCWQFNITNYKSTPDWLNARYWANPDNFDKYRW